MKQEKVKHTIDPVYTKDSSILILGSFPSIISRRDCFYYANKTNRFWKVLSNVYKEEIENSIENKKEFLNRHKIALWDVISECEIKGSSDLSITNVIPNDISRII